MRRIEPDDARGDGALRISVNAPGLAGPNGPLPIHLTQLAFEETQGRQEAPLPAFLDLINHRFLALLHRAWAQAQPAASADRPEDDHFARLMGAPAGQLAHASSARNAATLRARQFFAGWLAREVRNGDGLAAMLGTWFGVRVTLVQNLPTMVPINRREQTRIGFAGGHNRLGEDAVTGDRFLDVALRFRIVLGPMKLETFVGFLPGGPAIAELADWVECWTNGELAFDVQLLLDADAVPAAHLDGRTRLGCLSWLGRRPNESPADEMILGEASLTRGTAGAGA